MQRFIFCLCLTLAASVRSAEIRISFSDYPPSSTPTNFHAALAGSGSPSDWKIVLDDVPPLLAPLTDRAQNVTKRAVLAQTSQDSTDEHFPLFIYDGETFKDFKFTTRFKIVGGVVEQMAGMVFRFQNPSNFYVLRASALGRNVRFYKMVDGIRSDPIGPQLAITTNTWHSLTAEGHGNQITCRLDGQLLMPPLQDNTFASGKVGLWTKSDAVSFFCDPVIEYTPVTPAAQALVQRIMKQQPRIQGLRIYTLNEQGVPHIIASKDANEIGQLGTDAEKSAITDGKTFFGRDHGSVVLTLPFRDRNGDSMAALRVRLKSFFGETEGNALTRGTIILKNMQAEAPSSESLLQ